MTIDLLVETCFTYVKSNYQLQLKIIFTEVLFSALDAEFTKATDNWLKYVYHGPPKDTWKKLYYIYGTKVSDNDCGIHHRGYEPQGKGYNRPESYRKKNNLYYYIIFQSRGKLHKAVFSFSVFLKIYAK